jgi:nucleotide-binding universal stress UspA family protein
MGVWMMFESILLAVDGSSDAKEASKYARDLGLREDAQVIVVHAFEPVPSYLGEPDGSRVSAKNISEGRRIAQQSAQDLEEAGLDVVVEVLEGPAAKAILSVADVRQPDLIVMGSRGHGDLTSLLLGSVSHRVLAHAQVPVLIVPESTPRRL